MLSVDLVGAQVFAHTPCASFCPTRPERAEAPSPGHRPGYNGNQQGAL